MNPKVTVIIPVYNQEPFLAECLSSVLSQTLREIEVLCINDGSTDSSLKIIREFQADDPRIICLDQPNAGVAAARNRGIETARGNYLIFLDPDDSYPSNSTLEQLYFAAINNDVLVSAGSFSIIDEETGEITTSFDGLLKGYTFKEESTILYDNYQFDYGFHRFLIQADFLRTNKIKFPPLIRFQDPPFLVETLIKAEKFYAIPEVVYRYKLGHQTIEWNTEQQLSLIEGIRIILDLSRENSLASLHALEVKRLEEEYGGVFYWAIENPDVFAALIDLNAHIDHSLISSDGATNHQLIAPLKQQTINAMKWKKDIEDLQGAVLAERKDKENAWEELDLVKEKLAQAEGKIAAITSSKTFRAANAIKSLLK